MPCGCCDKPVKKNQKALLCSNCSLWVQISCGHISKRQYDDANESFQDWECPKCIFCYLPFESEGSLILDKGENDVNTLPDEISVTNSFQIFMFQNFQITKVYKLHI